MKIYMAGKMGDGDYRSTILEHYDQYRSAVKFRWLEEPFVWPCVSNAVMGFDYVGPYSIPRPSDYDPNTPSHLHGLPLKHGGYIEEGLDGHERRLLSQACFTAIAQCDLFFAWIDTMDCYGTLAEIGYAKALGKIVGVYFYRNDRPVDPDETQEINPPELFTYQVEDLWLAFSLRDNTWPYFRSPLEAFVDFVSMPTVLRSMPYKDYLKTKHWQTMRARALNWADHKCQVCNSTERLEVHHRTYDRRGQEALTDLTVLCRKCHSTFHGKEA